MNRIFLLVSFIIILTGCKNRSGFNSRIPVAEVGKTVLYSDELPRQIYEGTSPQDSTVFIQNYINNWTKKKLLLMKAEENLSSDLMNEVDRQMEESRSNLLIYQYEKQLLLEKMDTLITETELENYYVSNENAFMLTSNIVKALFIQLPADAPSLENVRKLIRSNDPTEMHQLESYCFQFAEKYDDFNEEWIQMDRLTLELHEDIENQDNFLKRNTFYENADSSSIYMVSVRDYRLRSSIAPFDYVKNDIKRIILNNRRIELIQNIENGIYNDALKENKVTIY
ncbi:MAG TPA: hypothetical protein VK213_01725 [Bacteroidales bacterium]|nr:hypothetical protein [Bacteroidales bacterium]